MSISLNHFTMMSSNSPNKICVSKKYPSNNRVIYFFVFVFQFPFFFYQQKFQNNSKQSAERHIDQEPIFILLGSSEGLEHSKGRRRELREAGNKKLWVESHLFFHILVFYCKNGYGYLPLKRLGFTFFFKP